MVRLIPQSPDFSNSTAEQAVWERLAADLPADAALIHSQRLTAAAADRGPGENRDVEADVIVLWPGLGIAVVEVKGGRVGIADGEWYSDGAGGRHPLSTPPLTQAMVAKHTLRRFLDSRLSFPCGPLAEFAALPYTNLPADWDVPDAPRGSLADAGDLDALTGRIAALLRRATEDHPDRTLTAAHVDVVVKNLRATHRAIENVRTRAKEIDDRSRQLTAEQEKLIRMLRHQNRAEIIGGAGSGKTHLALLKARELAREGKSVALMCYSRGLGRHLQLVTSGWPADERPDYVGLFHDLPIAWGAEPGTDDDSDYWERRLPLRLRELADERPRRELFDAIVVDEAQDFSSLWWDAVQSCLRNQVEGTLYVFTDERQRVFAREGDAPITMSPIQLDENLRNSAQIVETFAALALEPPIVRNGPGEEVEFISCSAEDAVHTADDQIERLLEAGWEPGDIALLTTGSRHPMQTEVVESDGFDVYWDEFFGGQSVFYGHVLGFKGLDRPCVVLCLNGIRSWERAAEILYVGLSRATAKLVVVGDRGDILAVIDEAQSDG